MVIILWIHCTWITSEQKYNLSQNKEVFDWIGWGLNNLWGKAYWSNNALCCLSRNSNQEIEFTPIAPFPIKWLSLSSDEICNTITLIEDYTFFCFCINDIRDSQPSETIMVTQGFEKVPGQFILHNFKNKINLIWSI